MSTEWKMVPVEPTDKMLSAVWTLHQSRPWPEAGRAAYAAMLAASPQPAAQPEQPEPGGLTDAQLLDLALKHKLPCAEDIEFRAAQGTAPTYPEQKAWDALRSFTREVLATTRKRSDEEVARIMEAVNAYAVNSFIDGQSGYEGDSQTTVLARAKVKRLLKGEA